MNDGTLCLDEHKLFEIDFTNVWFAWFCFAFYFGFELIENKICYEVFFLLKCKYLHIDIKVWK